MKMKMKMKMKTKFKALHFTNFPLKKTQNRYLADKKKKKKEAIE